MAKYWFVLVILFPFLIHAEMPGPAAVNPGQLEGSISDAHSGEPLGWTVVLLDELHRSISAHEDGTYHLRDIPPGIYTLKTFRVAYQDSEHKVHIKPGETTELHIELIPAPLFSESIVVAGRRGSSENTLEQPDIEVSGKKLRQNLGRTIAETIDLEPGVSRRSMGPGPARPVLRGLSGDRLLVLEDGERTGDLSATSSDHAVTVEPITAQRIEVIRGPESLIYGSSTMGGVVNVIREYVPSNLPHRLTGSATLQGESVNTGYTGGGSMTIPVGSLAVQTDVSLRKAGDVQTPGITLMNTGIETRNASFGIGYYGLQAFAGSAFNYYSSEYGIPPDPLGGHPAGVNVDILRRHLDSRAEWFPELWHISHLELRHTYSEYRHIEREASGRIGMEFNVNTHNASVVARLKSFGRHGHGALGLWGEYRDYMAGGLSFTPAARQNSLAAFAYQEVRLGPLLLNASLRYDLRSVTPDEKRFSPTVGLIRRRNFDGVSASAATKYNFSPHLSAGLVLMRSFRAPGIEELYSEGPHLAAYSYEVGNAGLNTESGIGVEAFVNYQHAGGSIHLAVYQNRFDGYVFPKNTGQRSWRRADLFVYRFSGLDAVMRGAELQLGWKFSERFSLNGTASYVRGKLVSVSQNLPRIPPLEGRIILSYNVWKQFTLSGSSRMAARQDKVGEFEQPTPGYAIYDLSAQYLFSATGILHTFALTIQNITDQVYYHHLNRVREIMPEPGRNVRLLYKIYF